MLHCGTARCSPCEPDSSDGFQFKAKGQLGNKVGDTVGHSRRHNWGQSEKLGDKGDTEGNNVGDTVGDKPGNKVETQWETRRHSGGLRGRQGSKVPGRRQVNPSGN